MKYLIITGIIALIALSSCEKTEDPYDDTMHLMAMDAIMDARPLFAVEVYYQDRMICNLVNSPSPSCDPREGICDDLSVTADALKDRLTIEWLVSHPEEETTHRMDFTIPYSKVDSIASGVSITEPEEKAIVLYLNIDEVGFHDCGVFETISW